MAGFVGSPDRIEVIDCTQEYPTLQEYSKQCLQTWEPSPHFVTKLDDDQLTPSAFYGSDHQGLAVPTFPQEQSGDGNTKVVQSNHRAALCVPDFCGGPVFRNSPPRAMSQKESSSQATADTQSGMDTDVTGTLAAPATPPEHSRTVRDRICHGDGRRVVGKTRLLPPPLPVALMVTSTPRSSASKCETTVWKPWSVCTARTKLLFAHNEGHQPVSHSGMHSWPPTRSLPTSTTTAGSISTMRPATGQESLLQLRSSATSCWSF